MPVDKEIISEQLKALGDFDHFFTQREVHYLPEVMIQDEVVCGIASGIYEKKNWIIVVTNFRLLFLDKNLFFGLKQVDIPLPKIMSVAHSVGLFYGVIEIGLASGNKSIDRIPKKDVLKISAMITELLRGKIQKPLGLSGSGDLAMQLEKLAALKEKGFLTEEEFKASKAKLIQ